MLLTSRNMIVRYFFKNLISYTMLILPERIVFLCTFFSAIISSQYMSVDEDFK